MVGADLLGDEPEKALVTALALLSGISEKLERKFFLCVCVEVFVSVDGLCPEEGFKGVWVSRSIVVVVLVGL